MRSYKFRFHSSKIPVSPFGNRGDKSRKFIRDAQSAASILARDATRRCPRYRCGKRIHVSTTLPRSRGVVPRAKLFGRAHGGTLLLGPFVIRTRKVRLSENESRGASREEFCPPTCRLLIRTTALFTNTGVFDHRRNRERMTLPRDTARDCTHVWPEVISHIVLRDCDELSTFIRNGTKFTSRAPFTHSFLPTF